MWGYNGLNGMNKSSVLFKEPMCDEEVLAIPRFIEGRGAVLGYR